MICEDVNWRLLQALQYMKIIMDDRAILTMRLAEMGGVFATQRGVFILATCTLNSDLYNA